MWDSTILYLAKWPFMQLAMPSKAHQIFSKNPYIFKFFLTSQFHETSLFQCNTTSLKLQRRFFELQTLFTFLEFSPVYISLFALQWLIVNQTLNSFLVQESAKIFHLLDLDQKGMFSQLLIWRTSSCRRRIASIILKEGPNTKLYALLSVCVYTRNKTQVFSHALTVGAEKQGQTTHE